MFALKGEIRTLQSLSWNVTEKLKKPLTKKLLLTEDRKTMTLMLR